VADYEDRNWGFRFGEGLMPKVANGTRSSVAAVASSCGKLGIRTPPWRHSEKPGVVRLLAYTNYANMGIYRDAVALYLAQRQEA